MPTGKIKVLHVIARFNIGGTARYLGLLLPEMRANNLDTLLAVGRIQAGEVEDSNLSNLHFIRIESLGRRISLKEDIKAYFNLRQVINEYRPELIHTHTFKAGLLVRLMHFRIPKVHTYHGHLLKDPEFSKFQKKVIVKLEKMLARFTQKLIVTGRQVAIDLIQEGVGIPSQYLSIPGIDYNYELIPRGAARGNLNLVNEFTIIWVGRVVPVKNPKLLVEVARLMPDCKFLMAGDGIELEHIRSMKPNNLEILGFIDVREILLAGDLFLSTSLNEGIPYSILEAQSAGLPVVAVNAGALAEIVTHGHNGFLVAADPNEIVNQIRKLQSNPELLEEIMIRTKEGLSSKSVSLDFTQSHLQIYTELLESH